MCSFFPGGAEDPVLLFLAAVLWHHMFVLVWVHQWAARHRGLWFGKPADLKLDPLLDSFQATDRLSIFIPHYTSHILYIMAVGQK